MADGNEVALPAKSICVFFSWHNEILFLFQTLFYYIAKEAKEAKIGDFGRFGSLFNFKEKIDEDMRFIIERTRSENY